MKLTTLDVLIVTSLANKLGPVVLPQSIVNRHSEFIKKSPIFTLSTFNHKDFAIYVREPKLFKQKLCYWRHMYKQDRLLPFAQNSFSALRLANNAKLLASTLFSNKAVEWDLEQDKCLIIGKEQPGSGLRWAWDWFAVHHIVWQQIETTGTYNEFSLDFPIPIFPQLNGTKPPHKVSLKFVISAHSHVTSTELSSNIQRGKYVLYCALDTHRKFPAQYPPLYMVERSTKATFAGIVVDLSRLNGFAQKMLWLGAQKQGRHVPFAEAFREVYGRKKRYVPHLAYGKSVLLDKKRKIKILKNARLLVKEKLDDIIDTHQLPYKITIYAGKKGFQLIIDPK